MSLSVGDAPHREELRAQGEDDGERGDDQRRPAREPRVRGRDVARRQGNAVGVRFPMAGPAAAKTSFHGMTQAKTARAAMPGAAGGSTAFMTACRRVQPGIRAVSTSSSGLPQKSEKAISTAKGRAGVACTSARPGIVSARRGRR